MAHWLDALVGASVSELMDAGRGQRGLSVARRDRYRSSPLAALVCVLLLFAQGVELAHDHDEDHPTRYECDICLQMGSGNDAVPSSHDETFSASAFIASREVRAGLPLPQRFDLRARAPPQD